MLLSKPSVALITYSPLPHPNEPHPFDHNLGFRQTLLPSFLSSLFLSHLGFRRSPSKGCSGGGRGNRGRGGGLTSRRRGRGSRSLGSHRLGRRRRRGVGRVEGGAEAAGLLSLSSDSTTNLQELRDGGGEVQVEEPRG